MDLMAIQESPKTQKFGMVKVVLNNMNPGGYKENVMMIWNLLRTKACLPSRLASFHYLYNDPVARPAVSMIAMVGGAFVRARIKMHYGTFQRLLFPLIYLVCVKFANINLLYWM